MANAWIVSGSRTPIGKFLGEFSGLYAAPVLAMNSLAATLERVDFAAARVEEVLLGQVVQAGVGQAPARQAALLAGLPASVPATTINKVCGSGLKAVMLAEQAIRLGDAQAILAGGMESMSNAPHYWKDSRRGVKFGNAALFDAVQCDGLTCTVEQQPMGSIADATAEQCGITRAEQDAFALNSHTRALAAANAGDFQAEIVSWEFTNGKTTMQVNRDENLRPNTTLDSLSKLRPAFSPSGTVTAGNASQLGDGAATVLVVNETIAAGIESPVKARIVASVSVAREPRELFLAPIDAIRALLAKTSLTVGDIDLFELNEAFAVQCLACMRELSLPPEKVNVRGGAIALGHPLGASGARILVTLLYALAAKNKRRGIAALCLGGGGAVAMLVERPTE